MVPVQRINNSALHERPRRAPCGFLSHRGLFAIPRRRRELYPNLPRGLPEPQRYKLGVYVMTHAHRFFTSRNGPCNHESRKRQAHTGAVRSSWIAPEREFWLFPGRLLAFPQTGPNPQPELLNHRSSHEASESPSFIPKGEFVCHSLCD